MSAILVPSPLFREGPRPRGPCEKTREIQAQSQQLWSDLPDTLSEANSGAESLLRHAKRD